MSNASFAGKFKVSTRIYTGFGLILILLIAVVALGYRALTHVAADLDNYVVYANQGVGVLRVRAEAADMRRTVLGFVDTGDEKAAAAVRQVRANLQKNLRDLSASFRSAERKAAAEQMMRMVDEYAGHFDKVEALRRNEKETIDNKLTPLAVAITADMSKILDAAFADGFTENAALTGKAQERFAAARIRALRYISSPDAAVLQDFRSSIDAYARLMDDLIARLQVPERKQLAIDTKAKAVEYAAGFYALSNEIVEVRKLIYQVMAPLGAQFAGMADKLADETSAERAKVELDAEAAIDANITTSITVAVIALVSGLLLAVLAARSITAPVNAMTGAMTRLAAGDLTVDVPATADRDEIGEMAKAVLVFKDNAVQKKRMDEAEAARLAAEREQEEAQRRREQAIGAEIAALIDSVSKGELDRRIDLAGKDGFYKTMSEGVNRLTDTVQSVIGDVGDVLSALASGDLTKQVTRDYQGAFGKMKTDVNATSQRLAGIVGDITAAAETIASAAAEVSTGSTDLAERTEQQASSLEETAASMEELSGTVRSNADNAQRANRMAEDARRAAESGGGVAGSAIEAMKRIEDASRKITDIIGVIDEIAFQTNLLALNAAVEAARAGDAG
ncbi:MAG TPA: methyl-accepting chemotaxis protein, partial [Azospirillaceae bacterium]|nr:methyl-accepting chemotaxis protein [Azospirillaceae bacterium]